MALLATLRAHGRVGGGREADAGTRGEVDEADVDPGAGATQGAFADAGSTNALGVAALRWATRSTPA